jgi:hypothetical protein
MRNKEEGKRIIALMLMFTLGYVSSHLIAKLDCADCNARIENRDTMYKQMEQRNKRYRMDRDASRPSLRDGESIHERSEKYKNREKREYDNSRRNPIT